MDSSSDLAIHTEPVSINFTTLNKTGHQLNSKTPTPLAIRLLRDMDEEIWMSGSELKTDNSSSCCSDTEESPEQRLDKMRKRTKRRTRSTKSYFDNKSTANKLSIAPLTLDSTDMLGAGEGGEATTMEKSSWRPKRGSIASLPGLQTDLENIEKS